MVTALGIVLFLCTATSVNAGPTPTGVELTLQTVTGQPTLMFSAIYTFHSVSLVPKIGQGMDLPSTGVVGLSVRHYSSRWRTVLDVQTTNTSLFWGASASRYLRSWFSVGSTVGSDTRSHLLPTFRLDHRGMGVTITPRTTRECELSIGGE